MTETPEPYGLALPDTRLASERLWCSSARSVLHARLPQYPAHTPLGQAYVAASAALALLEWLLRDQEEGASG